MTVFSSPAVVGTCNARMFPLSEDAFITLVGGIPSFIWSGDQHFKHVPWADVVAYGAVPDGTTDCSAAFAAAVAEVNSDGGGIVFIPQGNYYVPTGITDGANQVYFQGVGRAPDFNFTTKGTVINVGTQDVPALTLNNQTSSAYGITFLGCNSRTATASAVVLANSENIMRDCQASYGASAIDLQGSDWVLDRCKFKAAYGSANVLVSGGGGGYMRRCKVNHSGNIWVSRPASQTTISAWAHATVVPSTMVTVGSWLVQYASSGVTGTVAPNLTGNVYSVAYADGTATYMLVAPTTFYGLLATAGAGVYASQCDFGGAYLSASASFSSTPNWSKLTDCSFEPMGDGVRVAGEGIQLTNCHITQSVLPTAIGINLTSAFSANALIQSCDVESFPTGIRVQAGINALIEQCAVIPDNVTGSVGIQVDANVTDFNITGCAFTSPTNGNCATAINVSTGTGDRYIITNNKINGCSTGVNNGASGANKVVSGNF